VERTTSYAPAYPRALPANPAGVDDGAASAALVAVRQASGDRRTLVLRAPGATAVEVMGDFTDWIPLTLESRGGGEWEITLMIPAGLRRLNVRIDGGAWEVPIGATPSVDEYGTRAGLIIVP
jgi:1,4-alpha-glucan branching enzyme